MTWDESKHPRDENGKFTFKNGGYSKNKEDLNNDRFSQTQPFKLRAEINTIKQKTPAEILLGNSKTAQDNSIQKERNKLIDKLGNILTPAQVLYSSLDDLKKIEENNMQNKIDNDFKYDFKKHDELKDILLSHHSKNNHSQIPKGYELKEKYHSDKTGLDVEIYEHGNEIILSFPGSEQLADYKTDVLDVLSKHKNPQLDEAQDIFEKIKNNPQYKNKEITATGYSLGGNIAAGLSVLNNIKGVTFNSYGNLDKILQRKADDSGKEIKINPEKLINYRHEKDGISNIKNIGSNQELNEKNIIQNPIKNIMDNKILPHLIPNIPNINENNFGKHEIQNNKTTYYPKLSKKGK